MRIFQYTCERDRLYHHTTVLIVLFHDPQLILQQKILSLQISHLTDILPGSTRGIIRCTLV